jgi:hypothetical protein
MKHHSSDIPPVFWLIVLVAADESETKRGTADTGIFLSLFVPLCAKPAGCHISDTDCFFHTATLPVFTQSNNLSIPIYQANISQKGDRFETVSKPFQNGLSSHHSNYDSRHC